MSDYQPAATSNPLNGKVLEVFAESVVCDVTTCGLFVVPKVAQFSCVCQVLAY